MGRPRRTSSVASIVPENPCLRRMPINSESRSDAAGSVITATVMDTAAMIVRIGIEGPLWLIVGSVAHEARAKA